MSSLNQTNLIVSPQSELVYAKSASLSELYGGLQPLNNNHPPTHPTWGSPHEQQQPINNKLFIVDSFWPIKLNSKLN